MTGSKLQNLEMYKQQTYTPDLQQILHQQWTYWRTIVRASVSFNHIMFQIEYDGKGLQFLSNRIILLYLHCVSNRKTTPLTLKNSYDKNWQKLAFYYQYKFLLLMIECVLKFVRKYIIYFSKSMKELFTNDVTHFLTVFIIWTLQTK